MAVEVPLLDRARLQHPLDFRHGVADGVQANRRNFTPFKDAVGPKRIGRTRHLQAAANQTGHGLELELLHLGTHAAAVLPPPLIAATKLMAENPRQRLHDRGEDDRVRRALPRAQHVRRPTWHRVPVQGKQNVLIALVERKNNRLVGIFGYISLKVCS